jgi:hypothetical protein
MAGPGATTRLRVCMVAFCDSRITAADAGLYHGTRRQFTDFPNSAGSATAGWRGPQIADTQNVALFREVRNTPETAICCGPFALRYGRQGTRRAG